MQAHIRVRFMRRDAGAALGSSLLLELLHGTNRKQCSRPGALSPYFQGDVSRPPIRCVSCLHKVFSRRGIAGGDERDRLLTVRNLSRDADVSRGRMVLCRPA
jgi:hypothetical protein